MATKPFSTSRRSLIAAMAIAPVAIVAPAAALPAPSGNQSDKIAWDIAAAQYDKARTEADWYRHNIYEVAVRQHGQAPVDIIDRLDELGEAEAHAETRLMNCAAPDSRALRWKLDKLLSVDREGYLTGYSEDYVRQTVADYRRILGDAKRIGTV